MKTKEVDYRDMASSAILDMLTDYRNELATIEARKEWLSAEIDELQAILDERGQEECERDEE